MKKTLLLFAAAILTLTACNNDKTPDSTEKKSDEKMDEKMSSSSEDKEEQNKKTALASIDGFKSHNPDAILKDATPDGLDYGDGSRPPVKGIDSIKAGLTAWLNAFPDVKGENIKAVADGEWVMVWGEWSGTFKNDLMGMKATGKSYKLQDVDIFRFNDAGKITEHHNIQSSAAYLMQVGAKMSGH